MEPQPKLRQPPPRELLPEPRGRPVALQPVKTEEPPPLVKTEEPPPPELIQHHQPDRVDQPDRVVEPQQPARPTPPWRLQPQHKQPPMPGATVFPDADVPADQQQPHKFMRVASVFPDANVPADQPQAPPPQPPPQQPQPRAPPPQPPAGHSALMPQQPQHPPSRTQPELMVPRPPPPPPPPGYERRRRTNRVCDQCTNACESLDCASCAVHCIDGSCRAHWDKPQRCQTTRAVCMHNHPSRVYSDCLFCRQHCPMEGGPCSYHSAPAKKSSNRTRGLRSQTRYMERRAANKAG